MADGMNHRISTLLAVARAGDSLAVQDLFTCYQHYLRLLAHAGLSPQVQARVTVSDVVQETFLHAYQAFGQFRGRTASEFVAWLRSILASRIADVHEKHLQARRRDVRREVSIETIAAGLSQSSAQLETIAVDHLGQSPGTVIDQQERAIMVADAIAELPTAYQQVLVLRHFEGLSFDEIGAQLDRSSGAVRMIWLRAIRKMKIQLKDPDR